MNCSSSCVVRMCWAGSWPAAGTSSQGGKPAGWWGTCPGGQSLLYARESGKMLWLLEGVTGRCDTKLNLAARINP